MFGGSTTTAPDSPSAFGQINAASDAVIPWFQRARPQRSIGTIAR